MAADRAKRALAVLFGLVLAILVVEGLLQLGAAGARVFGLRAPVPSAAAEGAFRILCVGDSNTYGAGVRAEDAYPARLETRLRELVPGVGFQVLNLGVPGTNSAQVRESLPDYVDRYAPDLLVVLVGVNDYWNASDPREDDGGRAPVQRWLWKSRTWRLALLLQESLRPAESPASRSADAGRAPRAILDRKAVEADPADGHGEAETQVAVRLGDGHQDTFTNRRRSIRLDDAGHRETLSRNLEEIVAFARRADLPLVLPTYAGNAGHYRVANEAILEVDAPHVVPQTLKAHLAGHLPPQLARGLRFDATDATVELFYPDLHPKAPVYDAYAQRLAGWLLARNLVPVKS